MKRACFPRPGTSTVRVYKYEKWHFSTFFLQKMTSQQSVNTKIIACFPSSLFFVIIKRDFITDYLNVPAFLPQNFWFELVHTTPDDMIYFFLTQAPRSGAQSPSSRADS